MSRMSEPEQMTTAEIRDWLDTVAGSPTPAERAIIIGLCDRLDAAEAALREALTREAATRREVDQSHDVIDRVRKLADKWAEPYGPFVGLPDEVDELYAALSGSK